VPTATMLQHAAARIPCPPQMRHCLCSVALYSPSLALSPQSLFPSCSAIFHLSPRSISAQRLNRNPFGTRSCSTKAQIVTFAALIAVDLKQKRQQHIPAQGCGHGGRDRERPGEGEGGRERLRKRSPANVKENKASAASQPTLTPVQNNTHKRSLSQTHTCGLGIQETRPGPHLETRWRLWERRARLH
jgi:hypothetical protein